MAWPFQGFAVCISIVRCFNRSLFRIGWSPTFVSRGVLQGRSEGCKGTGQRVDFVATDILRINDQGQIADNWRLEDNLTFLKQIDTVFQ
jgi:hypothetical protein